MTTHIGKELHDRQTRGDQLTSEEQEQLDQWYQEQDEAEGSHLGQQVATTDISALREQLDNAITQLSLVSEHITEVMRANAMLRDDIAQLQHKLRRESIGHAA